MFLHLEIKNGLLPLYLGTELVWSRHICHILRCEKMIIIVKHGVSGDIFISILAKKNSNGRIIIFSAFKFIIHSDIHIHLSDILMLYGRSLQINQYEAFQDIVIENKVNKIILSFGMDMLLACYKRKSFAHLEQKFFKIVDYRLFKIRLSE